MPATVILIDGVGRDTVIQEEITVGGEGVYASANTRSFAVAGGTMDIRVAIQGHNADPIVVTQRHIVTVVAAIQGEIIDPVNLPGTISMANATMGETVAAPGQTGTHNLTAANATEGETAQPNILTKNIISVDVTEGELADPLILVKNVLQANATMGETATPIPITLSVVGATMGNNGLAVSFGSTAAFLTINAASMDNAGQAAEGFSPSQLADLKLWLAPESGVTVTAGRVTTWNDKSGLNNNAFNVVLSGMPTHVSAVSNMGGYNVVQFAGTAARPCKLYATNVAAVCAISSSALSTMSCAVVLHVSAQPGNIIAVGQTSAITANCRKLAAQNNNYTLTNGGPGENTAKSMGSALSVPHVIRWQSNNLCSFWQNGVVAAAAANVSANNNWAIGAAPMMLIGARGDDGTALAGHIVEIIVGATAWTSSQGRELDKLLGAKYGIAIT